MPDQPKPPKYTRRQLAAALRQSEERTRELSTLLTVGRELAATLELDPLLGLILIPDLFAESAAVQALRATAGARFALYYQGIRCWRRVPLMVKDKAVGMLTLQHAEPAYFAARHAELALAFADHAAVASENAPLVGAVIVCMP